MNLYKIYEILYYRFVNKNKLSKPEKHRDKKLLVIANGPSSKDFIERLQVIEDDTEYLCMNNLCYEEPEAFHRIKPKYYCAIDPTYWKNQPQFQHIIDGFMSGMATVDWDMYLITSARSALKIDNPHIHMIYLAPVEISGSKPWMQSLYRKNLSMPSLMNVAIAALYFGIAWQFGEVRFVGVELTNYTYIRVDKDNRLYWGDCHSYNKEIVYEDTSWYFGKVTDFWRVCITVFDAFTALKDWAEKEGIKVVNLSTESMLDMFPKESYEAYLNIEDKK